MYIIQQRNHVPVYVRNVHSDWLTTDSFKLL